jgi:hypothetical protein
MDVDAPARRVLPPFAWVAVIVGLGTALVTGQGLAQAQPHQDVPGGPSSKASAASTSPSGSTQTPGNPSGNQASGGTDTPGADTLSGSDTGTTPSGTGPHRHTGKPPLALKLPSTLSASMMPQPHTPTTSSLPSLAPLAIARKLKPAAQPATTPAATAAVVGVTKSAVGPPPSAVVIPAALTATSTTSHNLLTSLLGLVGLGPSAAPGAPTPLDNPIGWVVMAVVRRFGQTVSDIENTLLAQSSSTTPIALTAASSDPAAAEPASTAMRTYSIADSLGYPVVIFKYQAGKDTDISGLPPIGTVFDGLQTFTVTYDPAVPGSGDLSVLLRKTNGGLFGRGSWRISFPLEGGRLTTHCPTISNRLECIRRSAFEARLQIPTQFLDPNDQFAEIVRDELQLDARLLTDAVRLDPLQAIADIARFDTQIVTDVAEIASGLTGLL